MASEQEGWPRGGMRQIQSLRGHLPHGTSWLLAAWQRTKERTPVLSSRILIYRKMAFGKTWPSGQHGLPGAPWEVCVFGMPCFAGKHACPLTPLGVLASSLCARWTQPSTPAFRYSSGFSLLRELWRNSRHPHLEMNLVFFSVRPLCLPAVGHHQPSSDSGCLRGPGPRGSVKD